MRKVTVLHLHLPNQFGGGVYHSVSEIIRGLDPGHYHQILCFLSGPVPESESLQVDGLDVRELPYRREDLHHFHPKIIHHIRQFVKDEKVDIIHTHRHKSTVYATLAAIGVKNVKIVSSVHGMDWSRTLGRRLSNRLLWPRVNKIVAVSQAVREDIFTHNKWCPPEKVITIYNGINILRYACSGVNKLESKMAFGLPHDCWLWGAVGRLSPVKCHDTLLRAWAFGQLGRLGGHLAIAGSGDLHPQLEALAERLEIDQEVHFLGQVKDIPRFLAGLDGFVFPSRNEGFPLALMEALASGLTIVASRAGGIPEVLGNLPKEGHAFLVPPEQPEAMAQAMSDVMKLDRVRRQASRDAVRRRAAEFDGQSMIREVDRLYMKLARGDKGNF